MNKIIGKIVNIESSDNVSIIKVDIDGDIFNSMVLEGKKDTLNYKHDDTVTVAFKETEVGIAKNLSGMISLRNRFKAVIKNIDKGKLLTKISLTYKNNIIEAVITTQSSDQLNLKTNEEVECLIKTTEVTLLKNPS